MRTIAALAILSAVALTGCSSGDGAGPATSLGTPAAQPSTTPARALSPRGNDIRKPGDLIGWNLKDGSGQITAAFDNFVVSTTCTGGPAPKNGAYLTFDLTVNTPASPTVSTAGAMFHRDGYSALGPDGVTARHLWTDNTYACANYDGQWTDDLTPGATFKGKVVLDIPAGSAMLMFNPSANDTGGGDEWPLPSVTSPAAPAATASPAARLTDGDIRLRLIDLGCSTSGCIQTWFACRDGQMSGTPCDFYRRNPIN